MSVYSHCLAAVVGASVAVLTMLTFADYEKAAKEKEKLRRTDAYYPPQQVIRCERGAITEVRRICAARLRSTDIKELR